MEDESIGDGLELLIHMLDSKLSYGCEFYGCQVPIAMSTLTERYFLTLTQAKPCLH